MAELQTNEYIGNFKILGKYSEGGMALIYKAVQPSLKRTVILKKLKDPNREIIRRFKKEALLSASFHHENLVSIYDFLYINRNYYLVMEYVDGEDLRTLIDYLAPFPPHLAALIGLDIARALEYTHNRNIIHRDIKPSNILISYEGDVKLIDFGVAKDDVSTRLTLTGMIVGTPAYMSPEQANGEALTIQSDLFSLGILLYEMLTGTKPFFGETNTEILSKLIRNKFLPPERINPEIPRPMRRIIRKALKKDARKRYQNATEMIHDLERVLSWQVRSQKKKLVANFLERLNKARTTTSTSMASAFFARRHPGRAWTVTQALLVLLTLTALGFETLLFQRHHLTWLKLDVNAPVFELRMDQRPARIIGQSSVMLGPMLSGSHRLELRRPESLFSAGYFLTLPANDTTRLTVQLPDTTLPAAIGVNSHPAGVDVFIDGQRVGTTPLTALPVSGGAHTLTLKKQGQIKLKRSLSLVPGRSYSLYFDLREP